MLTAERASQFADIALGHTTREFPNKLDHVLTGPADLRRPRELHPIFYGSLDWHSCVHGYWLLARVLRRHPQIPQAKRIRARFASAFTPEHVSTELAYLARPFTGSFERPYGWAWLLMLAAELAGQQTAEASGWCAALAPLADAFAKRFVAHLRKATYPMRTGVHSNTAFALALALEYATVCQDNDLAEMSAAAARRWYSNDADCQAWEPDGEDFLSPCLIEAECMRRVLPRQDFPAWFSRFLPRLAQRQPVTLFRPVAVSDRSDGRIAHLDGLNLTRAWCWASLANTLDRTDARVPIMRDAAATHLEASLPHITEDYMGEHWLATFACLALETCVP
jgi:hypothetical protein